MGRSLRGRLVLAAAISLALLGSATAGRSARRVRGARRGGGRPDSRRCGCGCGGGLPPPPPPPPPSSDCSACPVGQYLQTACTSTRNRVCASCSTRAGYCAAGHFLSGCGSSGAGSCVQCAACPSGQYRVNCGGQSPGQSVEGRQHARRPPAACAIVCAAPCACRPLPDS